MLFREYWGLIMLFQEKWANQVCPLPKNQEIKTIFLNVFKVFLGSFRSTLMTFSKICKNAKSGFI